MPDLADKTAQLPANPLQAEIWANHHIFRVRRRFRSPDRIDLLHQLPLAGLVDNCSL